MKQFKFFYIFVALILSMASCVKDKEPVLTYIKVLDSNVSMTTDTSASVVCKMQCNNINPVVCYSVSSNFTGLQLARLEKQTDGTYTATLTDLQPGTTYYVCYKIWNGNSYLTADNQDQFSTSSDGARLGHEYVDLGLSVKWATCNVGATQPEEYGNYYAWGETSPKTNYSWGTYKYCKGSGSKITKYCDSYFLGTEDNKTTLEASDDAAHVNWGGNWRMPTHVEQQELYNNCTVTWIDNYEGTGVSGRIFTSNKTDYTDKSIFLPAAGCRYDTSFDYVGLCGLYLSSSLNDYSSDCMLILYFDSDGVYINSDFYYRNSGRSVRAVCP